MRRLSNIEAAVSQRLVIVRRIAAELFSARGFFDAVTENWSGKLLKASSFQDESCFVSLDGPSRRSAGGQICQWGIMGHDEYD